MTYLHIDTKWKKKYNKKNLFFETRNLFFQKMKLLKNHQTFHVTWHRKENEYSNLNELFSAIVVRFLSPSRKKSHKTQSRFASTITLRKNPKNRS